MTFGPGHTEDNNNNNNINRYLETFPIENYITALTKTEMHNKQQNLIGKATYTMFEKQEKKGKSLNREEMCFQKFLKLVCGFCGFNERRYFVPFCGCSYMEEWDLNQPPPDWCADVIGIHVLQRFCPPIWEINMP